MIVGSLIRPGRADLPDRRLYRRTQGLRGAGGIPPDSSGSRKRGWCQPRCQPVSLPGTFPVSDRCCGCIKGAIFAANVYEKLGFGVVPNGTESRHDIIQAITFGTPEGVIKFCEGIQAAAPVDSFVTPEPWAMRDTILMSSWQQERSFRGPQSNFPQTVRSSRRTRYTSRADSHGIMRSSVS